MPWSRLNSPTIQSTIALSKLSPPRWLSPFVAFTSKTPSPSSRIDTSNVPPPRSKTRIVWSAPSLSSPYASDAAVGSLMIRKTFRPAMRPASFVASRCALLKYAGTVMTASVTDSPRYASASAFSFWRIIALISGGAYSLPPALTRTSPFGPLTTSYGTIFISSVTSSNLRPMNRLIEKIVLPGFVTCCRFAGAPTRRWPSLVNATTDGVVRPPSAFGMTVGSPPSRTAMHEFVVPRSMPIVFAMRGSSKRFVTSGRIKSKPAHVKVSRGRAGLRLARAAARRLVGPRHREPTGVGHGQVQLPLHVLHAGRGPRMAAEAGGAELRGDRTARARARAHGRARGAADGRRAARPARPPRARADARRRARRGRPLADDERRPARPARGAARRGRAEADQRLARLAQPRPL